MCGQLLLISTEYETYIKIRNEKYIFKWKTWIQCTYNVNIILVLQSISREADVGFLNKKKVLKRWVETYETFIIEQQILTCLYIGEH